MRSWEYLVVIAIIEHLGNLDVRRPQYVCARLFQIARYVAVPASGASATLAVVGVLIAALAATGGPVALQRTVEAKPKG